MANQNNAQEWVKNRCWANGWNVEADATLNAEEFASQYEKIRNYGTNFSSFLPKPTSRLLKPEK